MSDNLFQDYVNVELPKRISTSASPMDVVEGMIPVTSGLGLAVNFMAPDEVPGLDIGGKSAYEIAVEAGFEGTEEEWLLTLIGPIGKSAFDHAVEEGFEGDVSEWLLSLVGAQGEDGPAGPPLNFLGSVTEVEFYEAIHDESHWELGDAWIVRGSMSTTYKVWGPPSAERPEGDWVDSGDMRGPAGTGLIIRGEWTLEELPMVDNTPGDTYGWNKALYTWMLGSGEEDLPENYKWVQIVPEGPEGPIGPKGNPGERGTQGVRGEKGDAFTPFVVMGHLSDVSELPSVEDAVPEEAYSVVFEEVSNLYVFVLPNKEWVRLGPWQGVKGERGEVGPQGEIGLTGQSTYELAVEEGFEGSGAAWLESIKGQSAYKLAVEEGFVGDENAWLTSLQGSNMKISGSFATLDDLFASEAPLIEGTSYAVRDLNELYYIHTSPVTSMDDVYRLGVFKGAKGDVGETGPVGPIGPHGKPIIVTGSKANLAEITAIVDPEEQDAYVDLETLDMHIFVNGRWVNIGSHKGDKGDRGYTGATGPRGLRGERGYIGNTGATGAIGPVGPKGDPLKIKGNRANLAAIQAIVNPEEDDAYVALDDLHLYIYIGEEWVDLGSHKGDKGDVGPAGPEGEKGNVGDPLRVKGSRANFAEIQDIVSPEEDDAYVSLEDSRLYIYLDGVWIDLGTYVGPQGEVGPEGPVGPQGEIGETGPMGDSFEVIAVIDSFEDLPLATMDNYRKSIVVKNGDIFYNLNGDKWFNLGKVGPEGPKGDSLRIIGEIIGVATLPNLSEDQAIPNGGAYIVIIEGDGEEVLDKKVLYIADRDTNTWDGPWDLQGPRGEVGPAGPVGPRGEVGQGIKVIGIYPTFEDLELDRPVSELGDAFLVGSEENRLMYVWTTDETPEKEEYYKLVGEVTVGAKGDIGETGPMGPQGIRGIQGFRGEKGSRWIVLPESKPVPDNTIGVVDDWCVDRSGQIWYRDFVSWKMFIQLFDVPVTEVPAEKSTQKMVRQDFDWVELPVDEVAEPVEGEQYVRVKKGEVTEWQPLAVDEEIISDVIEGEDSTKAHVRTRGSWQVGAPSIAGLDGSTSYLLKGDGSGWTASVAFEDVPQDENTYVKSMHGWMPSDVFTDVTAEGSYYRTNEGWIKAAVYDEAPKDGKTYGRKNAEWITVVNESPNDNLIYGRQTDGNGLGGWKLIPVSPMQEDAPDAKGYLRVAGGWVEYKPMLEPTAGAGKVYGRTNDGATGSWVEIDTDKSFDTYSLKTTTVSSNVTINVVNQQCYTVTIAAARTITLQDGPAGRMVTAVIVLTGGSVVPTFPGSKVKWNNGEVLTLGATKTVMTALWDGSEWILSKGPSY